MPAPKLLSVAAVVKALENAFHPLECDVTLVAHGGQMRFLVSDPTGRKTFRPVQMFTRLARKPEILWSRIYRVRSGLKEAGMKLDPWAPPK
jgi:hypothetical protein